MTTTIRFRRSMPWDDAADERTAVADLVAAMTLDEKLSLVSVAMSAGDDAPDDALGSAAYCAGVERVGVPAWDESDASLGVTNPNRTRGDDDEATAFPSLTALGATFDVDLAERMGRALGEQARQKGFSVQLAGGVNLVREPRGGRIFEYVSEDALLSGLIAGAQTRGIQSEGVVSTLKHFVLNPQETGRVMVSSDISEKNLRESDLLAFEIALEHGGARMIMPGYNMVNRKYASENAFLLTEVLKGDWRYPGAVISDWGATHSARHAAWAGLDRQSGYELDTDHYFAQPLRDTVEDGSVPMQRVDDMVTRILAALHSVGALEGRRRPTPISKGAHDAVAKEVAQESLTLLVNEDATLPLAQQGGRIVVVGEFAHVGVLSGGGSSTVTPPGSHYSEGLGIPQMDFPKVHHPDAPFACVKAAFPEREVVQLGLDEVDEVTSDDVVVFFAEKWASEGQDSPDLSLGQEQNDAITAIAGVAKRVVVVIESAGPVTMPWRDDVDAVLAAWYGGSNGAQAIADALAGKITPGGRLPVTWPATESDLPREDLLDPDSTTSYPGAPREGGYPSVDYDVEGADVGYRWWHLSRRKPLFPFGFGLSYTQFAYDDVTVKVTDDGYPEVSLTVTNTGTAAGSDVPQVYVTPPKNASMTRTPRLAAFTRVKLEPGESAHVTFVVDDDRVFSSYDPDNPGWTRAEGCYVVAVARDAERVEKALTLDLPLRRAHY